MIRKKRINDLAIIVIDNKIYSRSNVNDELWIEILEKCEEYEEDEYFENEEIWEDLMDLLIPERINEKIAEAAAIEDALRDAQLELNFDLRMRKAKRIGDISGLFEYDENGITYLVGFKHPMPKVLVEALLDAHYNPLSKYTVNSLVNFWKYLLLNPDKHVRKGLFQWIDTGNFALTEEGNIIAYRNVNVKKRSSSKTLQDFISENWAKVKKWKKSPKNYWVWSNDDGSYKLININTKNTGVESNIGNLAELYADIDTSEDATVFTDQYTGKMDIKIGEEVSMVRSDTDNNPDASCSRGLHAKSAAHGWNFGSEAVVMLVNPWNIVAIPSYDTSKFRTCSYLPIAKAEVVNNNIVEFEPGTYDLPYNGLESLSKLLETKSLKELQETGEISDEIEIEDFEFVMTKAREVINSRVIDLS